MSTADQRGLELTHIIINIITELLPPPDFQYGEICWIYPRDSRTYFIIRHGYAKNILIRTDQRKQEIYIDHVKDQIDATKILDTTTTISISDPDSLTKIRAELWNTTT